MSESDVKKNALVGYFKGNKKRTRILALILAILISFFALAPLGDLFLDKTCAKTINKKLADARAVSVGALAASVAIAAVPSDATSPLAEQVTDMADYMLLGTIGLTVEEIIMKSAPILLFKVSIPLLCIYLLVKELMGSFEKGRIMLRVFAFCLCLFLVDPLSVFLTNRIDNMANLQEKIDYIVDGGIEAEVEEVAVETVEITEETYTETVDEEDGGFFSDIANVAKSAYNAVADTAVDAYNAVADVVDSAVNAVDEAIDYAKALLSYLMDIVTAFIITTCLLPIAVLILLKYLTMYIFNRLDSNEKRKNVYSVVRSDKTEEC